MHFYKSVLLTSLWLITGGVAFSQDEGSLNEERRDVGSASVRTIPTMNIEQIRIDFSKPSPGSREGVCKSFPIFRTAEPDELLEIQGKVTLYLDQPATIDKYQVELNLKLEVAEFLGVDAAQYHRRLGNYKEVRKDLLLNAIKKELNQQRLQFGALDDDELLKEYSTPEIEQQIETRYMKLREKVVWSSELFVSETSKSNAESIQKIEIPFEKIVYPQNLQPWRVYKVSIAQNVRHESDQIGIFYTGRVLQDNQ